jgi:universal stress protein E
MQRFRNILYFADGVMTPGPALERAVALARGNRARLTLVDALESADAPNPLEQRLGLDLNQLLRERHHDLLETLAAPYRTEQLPLATRVFTGTPFVEVIRAVVQDGYDLLVKACRPPQGMSERLLGSTDMHLLRKCPCPVWIDRPGASRPYHNLLAAVDPAGPEGSEIARLVMDLATSLAARESARLAVVHAWRLYGESLLRSGRARIPPAELERLLEGTRQEHRGRLAALLMHYGLTLDDPQVHLVKGEPAAAIQTAAEQTTADLIVMGTVGRTGIPGFFIGNTAEEVLQTTHASVLAVKPRGFVSPLMPE